MSSLLQSDFHRMKINWESWFKTMKLSKSCIWYIHWSISSAVFSAVIFYHQWSKKYNVISLSVYISLLVWCFCLLKEVSWWWNSWLCSFIAVQVWVENVVVHWIYFKKSLIADKCSSFKYINLLSFALKINSSIFLWSSSFWEFRNDQ